MSEENKPIIAKEIPPKEEVKETKFTRINIEDSRKKFAFLMEEGCGFGEAYDAAFSILSYLLEAIKKTADKVKPKNPEDIENVDDAVVDKKDK
jgi:hypothetical protein